MPRTRRNPADVLSSELRREIQKLKARQQEQPPQVAAQTQQQIDQLRSQLDEI